MPRDLLARRPRDLLAAATPSELSPDPYHKPGAAEMFGRGMSLGTSDYVAAGGKYIGDKLGGGLQRIAGKEQTAGDMSYEDALRSVRAANQQFRDESPVAAYGSEIAGGIASPVFQGIARGTKYGLDKAAQFIGKQVPRYVGYGAQGAAAGAAAGVGNAQNERGGIPSPGDVGKSAAAMGGTGLIFGVGVPAVAEGGAKAVGAVRSLWQRPPAAMTQPQIAAASRAAYKAADDAGVVVRPDVFKDFVDELPSKLEGYRPRLAPKTADLIAELQDDVAAGKPVTLDLLDEIRQVARGASKTQDRNEIRLISSIVEKLDDFVDDLKPHQLLAGDADAGAAALHKARSLYRTNMKLRNIDDIIEIGENLNDTNWTRNQFRAIVRKPKLFNQYSADEQKIIKQLAQTGKLENIARMQPFRGIQMAAPHIAQIGQESKAAALQDLIARGGSLPPSSSSIPPKVLQALAKSGSPLLSPFSSSITGGSNQRP